MLVDEIRIAKMDTNISNCVRVADSSALDWWE